VPLWPNDPIVAQRLVLSPTWRLASVPHPGPQRAGWLGWLDFFSGCAAPRSGVPPDLTVLGAVLLSSHPREGRGRASGTGLCPLLLYAGVLCAAWFGSEYSSWRSHHSCHDHKGPLLHRATTALRWEQLPRALVTLSTHASWCVTTLCTTTYWVEYIDCDGIEPSLGTPAPVISCQAWIAKIPRLIIHRRELLRASPLWERDWYWRVKKPALQCSARCFPQRRPFNEGPSNSPAAPEGRHGDRWTTELCQPIAGTSGVPGLLFLSGESWRACPHGAAAANTGALGSQRCNAVRGASHSAGLQRKAKRLSRYPWGPMRDRLYNRAVSTDSRNRWNSMAIMLSGESRRACPHGAAAANIGALRSQRCNAVRGASHYAGLS